MMVIAILLVIIFKKFFFLLLILIIQLLTGTAIADIIVLNKGHDYHTGLQGHSYGKAGDLIHPHENTKTQFFEYHPNSGNTIIAEDGENVYDIIRRSLQSQGYSHNTKVVLIHEPQERHYRQPTHESQGYTYEKPQAVVTHSQEHKGYTYEKPQTVVTHVSEPQRYPAHNGYTYEKPQLVAHEPLGYTHQQFKGYNYEKPQTIVTQSPDPQRYILPQSKGYTYEKPQTIVTHSPHSQGYVYPQPKGYTYEKPQAVHVPQPSRGYIQPLTNIYEKPFTGLSPPL